MFVLVCAYLCGKLSLVFEFVFRVVKGKSRKFKFHKTKKIFGKSQNNAAKELLLIKAILYVRQAALKCDQSMFEIKAAEEKAKKWQKAQKVKRVCIHHHHQPQPAAAASF